MFVAVAAVVVLPQVESAVAEFVVSPQADLVVVVPLVYCPRQVVEPQVFEVGLVYSQQLVLEFPVEERSVLLLGSPAVVV